MAIEITFWDLHGKRLGKPVWEILGGKMLESVMPYVITMYITERERDPAEPIAAERGGFTAPKSKSVEALRTTSNGSGRAGTRSMRMPT